MEPEGILQSPLMWLYSSCALGQLKLCRMHFDMFRTID